MHTQGSRTRPGTGRGTSKWPHSFQLSTGSHVQLISRAWAGAAWKQSLSAALAESRADGLRGVEAYRQPNTPWTDYLGASCPRAAVARPLMSLALQHSVQQCAQKGKKVQHPSHTLPVGRESHVSATGLKPADGSSSPQYFSI